MWPDVFRAAKYSNFGTYGRDFFTIDKSLNMNIDNADAIMLWLW